MFFMLGKYFYYKLFTMFFVGNFPMHFYMNILEIFEQSSITFSGLIDIILIKFEFINPQRRIEMIKSQ